MKDVLGDELPSHSNLVRGVFSLEKSPICGEIASLSKIPAFWVVFLFVFCNGIFKISDVFTSTQRLCEFLRIRLWLFDVLTMQNRLVDIVIFVETPDKVV